MLHLSPTQLQVIVAASILDPFFGSRRLLQKLASSLTHAHIILVGSHPIHAVEVFSSRIPLYFMAQLLLAHL
jgi:hypothetical protein